tara:strand:- start:90 stop:587 length:498 start_codon:yes stop_codon:yes gene_type:complete
MKEIWKNVLGYEGIYKVSNLGKVKSIQKWRGTSTRILKDRFNKKGYNTVVLYKDKKSKQITVHQLVAMSFLNHKPNGMDMQVDHIDEDKKNNKVNNLQILSLSEHSKKTYNNIKSSSKYVGVSWAKHCNKWVSYISINGVRNNLGYFDNEKEAHKKRLKAECELY